MRHMTFGAVGLGLLLAWPGTARPQDKKGPQQAPSQPTRKIIYKKIGDKELPLHVFEPAGHKATDKRPALVYFHGGVWGQDSTSNFHPLCAYFAQRGMWVANAEFRLVPKGSSLLPDKLDVAFMIDDTKDALRYVREHAKELGVDPERIVAAGNSSGGHLAAAVAVFPEKDGQDAKTVSCRPNLLVLIAPALFLKLAKGKLEPEWFTKETPPTIQIVGTEDGTMLPFVKTVLELGKKQGFSVEAYTAEGLGHEFGRHQNWTHLMWYQVDRFLAKHGYLQGEPTMKLPDGIQFQQLK